MSTNAVHTDSEPLVFEVSGWPSFPPGVLPHDSVDLDADDPSRVEGRPTRQCVSARRADGERCGAVAVGGLLLCSMHAGLADPALAAQAKHRQAQERKEAAEEALGRRSLGTRATIADVLHREHKKIEDIVTDLLDRASQGDQKAQSLLIPYLNQGLGQPTERVEHSTPSTPEEIAQASTADLAAMVAERRRRRLQLVQEQPASEPASGGTSTASTAS